MSWLNLICVLLTALFAVFWESSFGGIRYVLGAQIDLLPPLMVYVSLHGGLATTALIACCGGLWFDSLSANPLGVSVLPLFIIGLVIYAMREVILREQTFAQLTLGLAASAAAPVLTLILLLTLGHKPLFGWGTLWQLTVMAGLGALATPAFFVFFNWVDRQLHYAPAPQPGFRTDREIRRGR